MHHCCPKNEKRTQLSLTKGAGVRPIGVKLITGFFPCEVSDRSLLRAFPAWSSASVVDIFDSAAAAFQALGTDSPWLALPIPSSIARAETRAPAAVCITSPD